MLKTKQASHLNVNDIFFWNGDLWAILDLPDEDNWIPVLRIGYIGDGTVKYQQRDPVKDRERFNGYCDVYMFSIKSAADLWNVVR